MSDPAPYEVQQVFIQSAALSANTVNINTQVVLTVKVREETVTVYPPQVYSNEIRAGEV